MELMQLQMVVAAAEEQSLQRAAARVGRTPQAVSMAIGKLEDELGIALFERASSRGFRLTAEGDVFVNYAKRSLALLDEAALALERMGSSKGRHLRIGANESIGEHVLPRFTHSFREQCPQIALKIRIGFSDHVLAALRQGEVDVALIADRPRDRDFRVEPLMTDRLIGIVSPRHRLANRASLRLSDLASESVIVLTQESELRERVVQTFRRFGVPLNLHVETATLQSIKKMVAQNMGIGIVPALCVTSGEAKDLIVREIDEFPEDRSLWIVHPANPSLACRTFVSLLRSAATVSPAVAD